MRRLLLQLFLIIIILNITFIINADNFKGELLTNNGIITENTSSNIIYLFKLDIDKDEDIDILLISDKEDIWLLRNKGE